MKRVHERNRGGGKADTLSEGQKDKMKESETSRDVVMYSAL